MVGADAYAHVYQPSAEDAKAVLNADLIIANGLGFEPWLERLIASSEAARNRAWPPRAKTRRSAGPGRRKWRRGRSSKTGVSRSSSCRPSRTAASICSAGLGKRLRPVGGPSTP
nr:zinc ABC transporter substrate-binding protein [Pseudomonas benzenivorans]